MRTTLDLNEALVARAKAEAVRRRTTLTRLIEEGLAMRLDVEAAPAEPRRPFRWNVTPAPGTGEVLDYETWAALTRASEEAYDRRQAGVFPTEDEGNSGDAR